MKILLDTCVLTILCDNRHKDHLAFRAWVQRRVANNDRLMLPAIADYELRRGLKHKALTSNVPTVKALLRLNSVRTEFGLVPLEDDAFERAADLWASARHSGIPTAPVGALDGDVLLAAQALTAGAHVVTDNQKHIKRYCSVVDWRASAA